MKASIRLKTLNAFRGTVQFLPKLNMFQCIDVNRNTTYIVPSSSIVYLIIDKPLSTSKKPKQSTTKRKYNHTRTTRKRK